jgi:adenylate cyclase
MPNKLSQFWQELKRRKVIKVIAMYAGAAYVLIELTNNVVEPLNLPAWTPTLVILILLVGFPITVILSWIFDVTPEGIKKTESIDNLPVSEVSSDPSSRRLKTSDVIILILLIAVCILLYPRIFRTNNFEARLDEAGRVSIAILPFKNLSPDTTNQYYLDGIMDAIINYMTNVENVRVIPSTSVEQYRNALVPISEIGKEQNVNYILEGSGQKYEENFRLTTKLSDAFSNALIWSRPYDREVKDILDLQSEIAQTIVSELQLELSANDRKDLKKKPTQSNRAYQNYLLGRKIWISDIPKAIELLEEAIEIDPNFVEPYVTISNIHLWRASILGDNTPWEEIRELAIPPIMKALEIDPNHANAHAQLGDIKYWLDWDFKGAEEEFLIANELSGEIPSLYGQLLIQNRRFYEAIELYSRKEANKPLKESVSFYQPYLFLGEYQRALEIASGSGCWFPRIYMGMGDYDNAVALFEQCIEETGRRPFFLSDFAISYYRAGESEKAGEIIEELIARFNHGDHGSIAFMLGKIYAGIDEVDLALEWLEKSYQLHELEMIWLYADPAFESLQENEQYIDLLKRVGFDV